MCVIGIGLSAISLFFKWYSFQIFSWENDLVGLWEFFLFSGWQTPFSADDWLNKAYEPDFLPVPMVIHVIYLVLMAIILFSTLGINLEKEKNIIKGKKFGYLYLSSVLISGYYICIVPIYFFIFHQLYFPYLTFTDPEFIVIEYGIAPGYWLQCVSFVCIFPYALYFSITTTRFERGTESFEKRLNEILAKVHIPIDFHQLIAEERVELENLQLPPDFNREEDNLFTQFIQRRGMP